METLYGGFLTPQEHEFTGSTPHPKRPLLVCPQGKWHIPEALLYKERPFEEVQRQRQTCPYTLSMIGLSLVGRDLLLLVADLDPETRLTKFDPVVVGVIEPRTGNITRVHDFSLTLRLHEVLQNIGHNLHLRGLPPIEEIFKEV